MSSLLAAMASTGVLLFLLSWCCFVRGYTDCGSQTGTLNLLEIPGCKEDERCILRRGTNATVEIDFAISEYDGFPADENANAVTAVVHGIILGVPVAFQLPNPDGCKDSGLECPLATGNTYHYQASLPVLRKYPKVTVDVKWELQDQDGKDIVCGLIPVRIQ